MHGTSIIEKCCYLDTEPANEATTDHTIILEFTEPHLNYDVGMVQV